MSLARTAGPIPRRMVLLTSGTARNGAKGRPHAGGSNALESRVGLHVSTSPAARAGVQVHGRPCYAVPCDRSWWKHGGLVPGERQDRDVARRFFVRAIAAVAHGPEQATTAGAPSHPTAIRETARERAGRPRSQRVSKRPEQDLQGSTGATARCAASAVSPGRLASAAPVTNCAITPGTQSGCTRSSRSKFGGSSSVPDPERRARCSIGRRCGAIFMPSGAPSPGHGGRMGRRAATATETIGHRAGCRPSPIRVLPSRWDKE